MGHECLKAHPRSLRPTVGYRSRFRASVGGIRIGPEDPQRQSARTRADQLELPPSNDATVSRRSDKVAECRHLFASWADPDDLVELGAMPSGARHITQSIGGVASPRHRRWVEAARADHFSARSCALTRWILGTDAHATYAGAEAVPVARCGL